MVRKQYTNRLNAVSCEGSPDIVPGFSSQSDISEIRADPDTFEIRISPLKLFPFVPTERLVAGFASFKKRCLFCRIIVVLSIRNLRNNIAN